MPSSATITHLLTLALASSVLCVPVELSSDHVFALEKRQNTTLKAPIVAIPSQFWEGFDGEWSTFAIRVGTPPQVVRVIPSTSNSEVWVISAPNACSSQYGYGPECGEERGGVWRSSRSSTWESKGSFGLGLNDAIGYSPYNPEDERVDEFAEYGYDSVGFGRDPSEGGPMKENVIVAQIESQSWWGGLLGLSPEPLNYTEFGDPQPSFTTKLKDEISSLAYSYTAGAKYKGRGVFGQLIYGGYDDSRFEENDAIFTMTGDSMRDIVITLRSIKASSNGQDTELLPAPEFVYIDSSIPEMVLPQAACDEFKKAFGLTHDETSGRYLLTPSAHDALKVKNPNITFTLANSRESQRLISITIPYTAFDLQLQKPLYNGTANSTAWFPLRQAPSEDTYALGRAFLQEAYLTVDYNSRTFNVSQALFPNPLSPRIIAVPGNLNHPGPENEQKPSETDPNTPTSDGGGGDGMGGGLSTGVLAGIIVAAVLGGLLLVTLIFFCCPCGFCPALTICGVAGGAARHRKREQAASVEIDGKRVEQGGATAYNQQASTTVQELGGRDAKVEIGGNPIMHPQEMEAQLPPGLVTEAQARQSQELAGSTPGGSTMVRPSAELEAGAGSSGLNVSSEARAGTGSDNQYLSSGSENISSISGESPTSRNARMAEVSGDGIRPFNGPPTRLGRVEEVVSPVSPTTATGGWGRGAAVGGGGAGGAGGRPGTMRVDTSEGVHAAEGERAPDTAMSWTPQTPSQSRRWNEPVESEGR